MNKVDELMSYVHSVAKGSAVELRTAIEQALLQAHKQGFDAALLPGSVPDAQPVAWIQPDHLQKARVAPFLCRVEPTKRMADFIPIYTQQVKGNEMTKTEELLALADALEQIINGKYQTPVAKFIADTNKAAAALREYAGMLDAEPVAAFDVRGTK